MTVRVYYEEWQLQCCGDGFAVGDEVTWQVEPAGQWHEEHHGDERLESITGTVVHIESVWQRHEESEDARVLTAVDGDIVMAGVPAANGYESDELAPLSAEYHFQGYVVTLDGADLVPPTKEHG
jgi:hypothetical protein